LRSLNMLLRMYGELAEPEKINSIKEKLQDLVLNEGFELTSKTYYTLGVCTSYKGQHEVALDYFQKALSLALASDDKEDICCAISGIAITYYYMDRLTDALKEIYNLKVFFQVLKLPFLRLSNLMLNAHILRKLGRCEEALEIFWDCYETLRTEKNIFMYVSLLYGMGITYQDLGDVDLARMYLKLAKETADPRYMRILSPLIEQRLKDLGVRPQNEYDLIFNSKQNAVTERKRGKVEFKNQFILLDLLHLFMKNPGSTFSKEQLVEKIWKQEYDPAVHDNKIYVTIKRLRKMIEPDFDKPKYIFRAKNGYYLNKNTRILVEH